MTKRKQLLYLLPNIFKSWLEGLDNSDIKRWLLNTFLHENAKYPATQQSSTFSSIQNKKLNYTF